MRPTPSAMSFSASIGDGRPVQSAWLIVRLYMAEKNHHSILVGPTDSQGVVEIPWVRVAHQVDRVRRFFIMDYAGLDQWTGRASVMFMDIGEVERYLQAAETWGSSSLHPRDEVESLLSYRALLLAFPVEDVDIAPNASPPGSVQFVPWV